jgi:alpha-tubulin suppressor-like RCC1 family protein
MSHRKLTSARHLVPTRLVLIAAAVAMLALGSVQPAVAASAGERMDAGAEHTCVVLDNGRVRCWGLNSAGQLGYGNTGVLGKNLIGDDETPDTEGPVSFGGPDALEVAAGGHHSCAILDDGGVRCWGIGTDGQLGYNGVATIGDNETPATQANVAIGPNRTATAVTAGGGHTCAILDNGKVRCWGSGGSGQLGYGNTAAIGDNETPASAGFVDLGSGRTATAIAAGLVHTCAILDNEEVRCWGSGDDGRLGYGNEDMIGDDETPATAGPVNLGTGGLGAKAIAAGQEHTCVILTNDKVRCWGQGFEGALGYGNAEDIGDDESPDTATVGHVQLGGVDAISLTAGDSHTCAVLADTTVRCWGLPTEGQLGLELGFGVGFPPIGDSETPDSQPTVDLAARAAVAITAGAIHTCAVVDTAHVHCWGNGSQGATGQGNPFSLGDDEAPGTAQRVLMGGLLTP